MLLSDFLDVHESTDVHPTPIGAWAVVLIPPVGLLGLFGRAPSYYVNGMIARAEPHKHRDLAEEVGWFLRVVLHLQSYVV